MLILQSINNLIPANSYLVLTKQRKRNQIIKVQKDLKILKKKRNKEFIVMFVRMTR